jgi:hypothetical protein
VQSANRQFIDFQFSNSRPLDRYSIDGQAADGERSNRDRADRRGAERERQKIGDRKSLGLNGTVRLMSNLREQNRRVAAVAPSIRKPIARSPCHCVTARGCWDPRPVLYEIQRN